MKSNSFLLIFLCCYISQIDNVFANNSIIMDNSNSRECYTTEVLVANPSEYKIRIKIHKISKDIVDINGTSYQKLHFDKISTSQAIGEPDLPTITQHIAIPFGCNYTAEIIENAWENIPVGIVYPTQKPITSLFTNNTFVINDSIYNCEKYIHPILEATGAKTWKGVENIFINLCPFIYYPSANSLSVLSDFTLTVKFNSNYNINVLPPKFEDKVIQIFDNRDCFVDARNNMINSNENNDYLIVVGNMPEIENSQSMNVFRKWKTLKGYNTRLVSTSTIGSDSASIKNFLTQQSGIKYVLFVGNNDKIPLVTLTANNLQEDNYILKSDYWYGCMDGNDDDEADFPVGRFLTNSLTDFNNMVEKTIKYESLQHDWCRKALLVSHTDIHYFQDILEDISITNYNHPFLFSKAYGAPIYMGGYGSDKYDVINYINSGMNIVTVNCHGNAGGFWMYDGNNSTISYEDRVLLNSNTYPVVFSNACYNGDFTNYIHSIAAYFSCSDHCSSAYSGTTMPSYIYAGNQYLQYLYSNLLNNELFNMGDLILSTHIMNLGFGNTAIDNAFNYICGGDPSLEIWTSDQSQFENVEISDVGNSLKISISNTSDFKVNVVCNDSVLLGQYSSGAASYLYIPKPIENCDIAIVKHDYIPCIIHINAEDLHIQNITFTDNNYYLGSPTNIGYNVDNTQTYGNVVVEAGAKLMINKGSGVKIVNGFYCEHGGEFVVK